MKLFKHSNKDIFPVLLTIIVFLITNLVLFTEPSLWWIPFAIIQAFVIAHLRNSSIHVHMHYLTFTNAKMNKMYDLLCALSGLYSAQTAKVGHMLHHAYGGGHKDPVKLYDDTKLVNCWKFSCSHAVSNFVQPLFLKREHELLHKIGDLRQRFNIENRVFKCYFLIVCFINFKFALLVSLIAILANIMDMMISYGEHYGAEFVTDNTKNAVSSYGYWYNLLTFNNGYHQEHHYDPKLHWSRLHEISPLMHSDRKMISTIHMLNAPFYQHFKQLFE